MELETVVRFIALALVAGLGLLFFGLARNITSYLSLRFTAQEIEIAKETTMMVVSTLKQSPLYENLNPEKKKELAVIWLVEQFHNYGLTFSVEDIDKLIEEAVSIIKEAHND